MELNRILVLTFKTTDDKKTLYRIHHIYGYAICNPGI